MDACVSGYGSGRASWATSAGHSDFAKTACVVEVHWRGGPITSTTACEISATFTISVAGAPCLTTISIAHHSFAPDGIAASNRPSMSDTGGRGSVITHTHTT